MADVILTVVLPILFAGLPTCCTGNRTLQNQIQLPNSFWSVTMAPLYLGQVVLTLQFLECEKELDIYRPWVVILPGTQCGSRLFEEQ